MDVDTNKIRMSAQSINGHATDPPPERLPKCWGCSTCAEWMDRRLAILRAGGSSGDVDDLPPANSSSGCPQCREWYTLRVRRIMSDADRRFADLDRQSAEYTDRLALAASLDNPTRQPGGFAAPKPISDLASTAAKVDYLWHGCIARGHLTLFSARMKAGKSTALSLLLRASQDGADFMGLPTTKCRTLVVSEESETIWAMRRDKLGLADAVHVISKPFMARPKPREWIEWTAYLALQAAYRKYDQVIFDTVAKLAPWENENDAAQVQAALTPLDKLTSQGTAVTLVHHVGNEDRTEGRASRGSTALPGAADIILELRRYRPDDLSNRQRVLSGLGRFDEIPAEVVVELSPDGLDYFAAGDRRAVAHQELTAKLMLVLPRAGPGHTADEIHAELADEDRPKIAFLKRVLRTGQLAGQWAGSGTGKRGSPHRFYQSS